jgi:DNA-binding NarL/FixJ family response regulator
MLQKEPELLVVGEAEDGLDAVQQAQALKPDLILMDVGLPKLNGIEAANRIRAVAPAAKILFLSTTKDANVVRAALSNGAMGYVLKPDAGTELLSAIEAVLRGEVFVSSRLTEHQ